jgi:WD40 repeat protein
MIRVLLLFILSSLTACGTATPKIFLSNSDLSMELKQSTYRNTTLAVSPDGKRVVAGNNNGDVTLWDIQNGRMEWKVNAHENPLGAMDGVLSVAFIHGGKKMLTSGKDKLLKVWDVDQGKVVQNLKGMNGTGPNAAVAVYSMAVSEDGKKAVTAGSEGTMQLWDLQKGALLRTLSGYNSAAIRGAILTVDITRDGNYSLSGATDGTVRLWNNNSGKEILKIPAHTFFLAKVMSVAFAKNDQWAFSGSNESEFRLWDLKTGHMIREISSHPLFIPKTVGSLSISRDGKYLLSTEGNAVLGSIKLREIETGQLIKSYRGYLSAVAQKSMAKAAETAIFHPDGKRFITESSDASVRIRDLDTGENDTLLVSFPDAEWIVITSEGYYNASEKGAEYLSVSAGGKSFDMNLFYDVFYRPDIVAAKLRGDDIKDLITITMKDAIKSPPPAVEFTTIPSDTDKSKVKVCYQAKNSGGGIGEVRLFHNGKLIQSDGYYRDMAKSSSEKQQLMAMNSKAIYENMRSVSVKGKTEDRQITTRPKGEVFDDCKEVETVSGENEVSVTAFNSGNTVQSYMKTVKFNLNRKPEDPHLYILSVGIDKYRDNTVNLKYAAKDATDIEQKLLKQSATVYKPQNIHYELLLDDKAGKGNIINKINELSRIVKPQDGFILFVAGHGVLLQNQYYMLTSDYDGMVNDASMISSNEIVEISKKIRSLSQLFIFDTCHAGGVDTIVSGLYDARMSVLAKKMGLHIYASANSIQEAQDGYQGNGLFTYTLLDGLNNKKEADKNRDNAVSLVELGGYVKQTTTEISKKINHNQTPLIINFGKDNPVYNLK